MRFYRALLRTYLAPLKGQVALLAALLAGGVGLQLVNPQIVRGYLDAAQAGAALSALAGAALAFLGIALLGQAVALAETYVAADVGWRATNALRADLATHCLAQDLAFHHARTPGELIERVDGDVSTLAGFFSRFVVVVLGNAVLLLGIVALVLREDVRMGLLFLTFSAASVGVAIWVRGVVAPYARAQRQASADLLAFLEERLTALPDLRANGAQAYTLYRAERLLHALFRRARAAVIAGTLQDVRWLIDSAAWVATFALIAALFRQGELTLGGAYLLVQYRSMINRPLGQIVQQLRDFQQASASAQRVGDLLATVPRITDGGRAALPSGPLDVTFDRVSFWYRSDAPPETELPRAAALRGVSFALPAGRVLGLLGRTGSGKSTLSRLLFRFYDAGEGAVRVGGVDVRDLALDTLRARVGLVTQDVQLFRATVRDNVTLFDPGVSDRRVATALEDVGLDGWLRSLPAGLDTPLGAGGAGLSAGEAQLLAFARVFLHDPGVVVLDEASSRLDPSTERRIDGAVGRLLAARTGVVIAHRLETVQRVDDVLILEDGAVAEYGPRARLAADPGSRFAALLRVGTLDAPAAAPRRGARPAAVPA
jgi:ABC-type multidrug transport system fused ATPase/permease subunit